MTKDQDDNTAIPPEKNNEKLLVASKSEDSTEDAVKAKGGHRVLRFLSDRPEATLPVELARTEDTLDAMEAESNLGSNTDKAQSSFCALDAVRERCEQGINKSEQTSPVISTVREVEEPVHIPDDTYPNLETPPQPTNPDSLEPECADDMDDDSEEFVLDIVRERCLKQASFSSRRNTGSMTSVESKTTTCRNTGDSVHVIQLRQGALNTSSEASMDHSFHSKSKGVGPVGIGAHCINVGSSEQTSNLLEDNANQGLVDTGTTTPTILQRGSPIHQSIPGATAVHGPNHSASPPDVETSPIQEDPSNPINAPEGPSSTNLISSLEMLLGTSELASGVLLEATLVDERPASGRNALFNNSLRRGSFPLAQAIPVNHHLSVDCSCLLERPRLCFCLCLWLVVSVAIGLALGLSLGLSDKNTGLPPSLHRIQKRGVLRCGLPSYTPGLHFLDEAGERSGFDVALCQAVAAAVLGDPAKVEFEVFLLKNRFLGLAGGEVDVLAAGTTHTMERQVFHAESQTGFSFSSPYHYTGLQLAGDPHFVGCTENGMKNTEECALLRVCTLAGSSHEAVLSELLPGRQLVVVDAFDDMVKAFIDGKCLVVGHEGHQLQETNMRDKGYRGPYVIGTSLWSREPLALVSRQDDPEWSTFLNLVLHGLLAAEKHNITKLTAHLFPQTEAFGEDYKDMFRDSIAAVGNYAELYSQYLEPIIPRKDIDQLKDNQHLSSGLLFSHPFGSTETIGDAAIGYIDQIRASGKVRCGIIPSRPGLAAVPGGGYSYRGIEIDLCRALSAALFDGFSTEIEIVPVDTEVEGFAAVDEGLVDIFAGASWTFGSYTSVSENGGRFSFSTPYFYNNTAVGGKEENLCLVATAREHAWSSFVYWILGSLVYAEENGLSKENANDMPGISMFGADYRYLFRDALLSSGNYGQLYSKSLEALYPRSGRNLPNLGLKPGPQHYPIPGLF